MGNNDNMLPIITEDEFELGQRIAKLEESIKKHRSSMEARMSKLEKSLEKIQSALVQTGDIRVLEIFNDAVEK